MPPVIPFTQAELLDPMAPPTVTLPDDPDPIRTPDGAISIPEFADVMTLPEWRAALEAGVFTAEDGVGHYATSFFMDQSVVASLDPAAPMPRWACRVAWFNK